MKIKTLLKQAAACNTEDDAKALEERMEEVFGACKVLGNLEGANSEHYMEGDKPFVRFELNHVISDSYITMIRPEIRDGALVVVVCTNRMLDGHGMHSQRWELAKEELEEVIETTEDQTVAQVAKLAAEKAMEFHAQLIEELGVSKALALRVAKKSWKGA